ncbi:MAG: LysR family transcriptional regulator [Alphaproteobacteria bacterium]|nr:LysR family transcriptional regulator [Alphaproteobacteria bacterium]
MIPSPADLAYFVEVSNTLNVSRAAERLGISQPSLSLALQRLERTIGTKLLSRSKRGVSLTQAGRQLLAHSKSLLEAWGHVQSKALASIHGIQGMYTIGCHPSVALYLLSDFLPQLMEKHPLLQISLRHDLSRKIAEDVISLKTDIGIVVNPVQHPDLVIHPLCRDEFTLWTGPKANYNAQDIHSGRAVLICDPDLAQSELLIKQLKKSGINFDRILTSGNLEVIADLTAHGCGLGLLPGRVASRAVKKLTRVPKTPVFYDDHCLIFRVENKDVKSIQALSAAIRGRFGKH